MNLTTKLFVSYLPIGLILLPFLLCAALIKVPNGYYYPNHPDLRQHPGHYPFISYLTFRNIADFVIDPNTEFFDPEEVIREIPSM